LFAKHPDSGHISLMSDTPPPDDPDKRLAGVRVSAAKCVRCGQPVQPRTRPFCSQRCAEADLGAWFTGRYRVETNEPPAEGSDQDEDEKS